MDGDVAVYPFIPANVFAHVRAAEKDYRGRIVRQTEAEDEVKIEEVASF